MQFINDSVIVTFLLDHLLDISLIVLISIFAIVKIERWIKNYLGGDTGTAMKINYSHVIEAEKLLGSSTGQIKKEQVISWFYTRYPVISMFISETDLSRLIDIAVTSINRYLERSGANLYSLQEEQQIYMKADESDKTEACG